MTADPSPGAIDVLCPADGSVDRNDASLYSSTTIIVCHSCRLVAEPDAAPRPGSELYESIREAAEGTGFNVKSVACLGNCRRGISVAMLRDGGWTYIFGDLNRDSAEDVLAGAALFANSSDAFMPFRERPEALKRGLIARIPTFESLKDLP